MFCVLTCLFFWGSFITTLREFINSPLTKYIRLCGDVSVQSHLFFRPDVFFTLYLRRNNNSIQNSFLLKPSNRNSSFKKKICFKLQLKESRTKELWTSNNSSSWAEFSPALATSSLGVTFGQLTRVHKPRPPSTSNLHAQLTGKGSSWVRTASWIRSDWILLNLMQN